MNDCPLHRRRLSQTRLNQLFEALLCQLRTKVETEIGLPESKEEKKGQTGQKPYGKPSFQDGLTPLWYYYCNLIVLKSKWKMDFWFQNRPLVDILLKHP